MRFVLKGVGVATAGLLLATAVGSASAGPASRHVARRLGFTPVAGPAHCDATSIKWPAHVDPTATMQAGDAATPGPNAFPTQTTVPSDNDMIAFNPSGRYLFTVSELTSGSAITRLDTQTGARTILSQRADWNRLDPIKWYAPEDKLLIGEEDGTSGLMWLVDPETGASTALPWLGSMSHEGVTFAQHHTIWMGDESHTGAIYKAIPTDPDNLEAGGKLVAMKAHGFTAPLDPSTATLDAAARGATAWDRPEDMEAHGERVYFSVTEPVDDAVASGSHVGGVYSVNAEGRPHVRLFVPLNDPNRFDQTVGGLQFPDNLAFDKRGNLYIHEDIPDADPTIPLSDQPHTKQARNQQDDLWVAVPDSKRDSDKRTEGLYRFATMGTSPNATPCQNEWSGGVFDPHGALWINQQHADSITWKVTFPR